MPSLTVNMFGTLRLTTSAQDYEVSADTIGAALKQGIERFGAEFEAEVVDKAGELKPGVILLIDGQNVLFMDGLDTPLEEGMTISLFPPSSGG